MSGRLDVELVLRGLARSRGHASELIEAGLVRLDGVVARRPATRVPDGAEVASIATGPAYVSRGAHKLAGALLDLPGVAVQGRRCLDAGASTGGFTQVLLGAGATQVVALDVGSAQLAESLVADGRVVQVDHTNVRSLDPATVGGPFDLVVADLSFISLRLVLPALARCTAPDGDLLVLVKPQFEVGRSNLSNSGVVRDEATRAAAVRAVAETAGAVGLDPAGVAVSRLPGPAGNVEVFLHLRRSAPRPVDLDVVYATVLLHGAGRR